jgi:hypothetical protein
VFMNDEQGTVYLIDMMDRKLELSEV